MDSAKRSTAPAPMRGPTENATPAVSIRAVTKRFGGFKALDSVSLDVFPGELFSLLGPSGCGKTTLLRLIAGLDHPDEGDLLLGGKPAHGLGAHERHVNTVFQSYALFPHLDVRGNLGFGLKMKGARKSEIAPRVAKVAALTRIEDLLDRRIDALSGGQKQRVALGRALINEPSVLLLDEPMAALDLQLRRELQVELKQLQRRLGLCFLLVTHDQDEALRMSDRLAVMREGRIEQIGTPEDVYQRPRTRFVASFLGACNVLEAESHGAGADPRETILKTPCGLLVVRDPAQGAVAPSAGQRVLLGFRPEKAIPLGSKPDPVNRFQGRVTSATFTGSQMHYEVDCDGRSLQIWLTHSNGGAQPWRVENTVAFHVAPESMFILQP